MSIGSADVLVLDRVEFILWWAMSHGDVNDWEGKNDHKHTLLRQKRLCLSCTIQKMHLAWYFQAAICWKTPDLHQRGKENTSQITP